MSEIIVTTTENIKNIVSDSVEKILKKYLGNSRVNDVRSEPNYLNVNELIIYLREKGIKMSKSTIYKLTMNNEIPFQRFGNREIFFVPGELDKWIDSRMSGRKKSEIINNVARAAKNKML